MFLLARLLFFLLFLGVVLWMINKYWYSHIKPWIFEEKINTKVQEAAMEGIEEEIDNEINKNKKRRKR